MNAWGCASAEKGEISNNPRGNFLNINKKKEWLND
jgi:hypothetical protein